MTVTIYHNPDCSASRNCLALIRAAGFEPRIVPYLREPYARERLAELITAAGLAVREALRQKGALYLELGLDAPGLSDGQLLDAMCASPILVERPFVETPLGVRLCRPAELVLEILPPALRSSTVCLAARRAERDFAVTPLPHATEGRPWKT